MDINEINIIVFIPLSSLKSILRNKNEDKIELVLFAIFVQKLMLYATYIKNDTENYSII